MPRSSRLRKKSCDSTPGRSVKTPCWTPPVLAPSTRSPPTSRVISLAVRSSMYARSTSRVSGASLLPGEIQLRNPSARGSSQRELSTSVCSWEASVRPGENGTVTCTPASAAAFCTAAVPPSTIRSASETRLPVCCSNSSLTRSSTGSASWTPALTAQPICGSRRSRAPLAPPRLSVPRNDAAADQAVCTSCETRSEEHTSELQSRQYLVCRLLLEKK